jgi:ribosomal protein L17
MRHNVQGRKLGRTTAHRTAMFRNQLASLMENEGIVTTLPKAKELRPIAEKIVTQGRTDDRREDRHAGSHRFGAFAPPRASLDQRSRRDQEGLRGDFAAL